MELELFREPGAAERREPHIVAIAGAKGGVGKTMLSANLAVYLAAIGRRVVVVDAEADGANVHSFLGAPNPSGIAPYRAHGGGLFFDDTFGGGAEPRSGSIEIEFEPDALDDEDETPAGIQTGVPGLTLLHAGIDEPSKGEFRKSRRGKLIERLRALDVDYAVVDLGAGTQRSLLDVFLEADSRAFVTLPEPPAIEGTYRFLRALFARAFLRGRERGVRRHRAVRILRSLGHTPPPLDLLNAVILERDDPTLEEQVRAMMESFSFPLVLNKTRVRGDLELGEQMCSAAYRRFGIEMQNLGHIDYDDMVWNTLRAGRPLVVESPGTKASRAIEKIARKLLAMAAGKDRRSVRPDVPERSHHDILEIDRGATDEEIRRAYKRGRELYAPGSLACYGLFDPNGLGMLRAQVDEAHDVLLDPARRRPYELSVFPPELTTDAPPRELPSRPLPSAPEITPETDFTGALLRAVRESQGASLRDVSEKTKIGLTFLKAIEEDDFTTLPAPVYVRGFLSEVAKFLGLDVTHVTRSYVHRMKRHREGLL